MKRLWRSRKSVFARLLLGLGGIHLLEDTLEDVILASVARFVPMPVWALYTVILVISLTFLTGFTYFMTRYAYRFAHKD